MKTPHPLIRFVSSFSIACPFALVVSAGLLAPGSAPATLGGDASTVELDRSRFPALRMTSRAAAPSPSAYTVHELQLAGGINVREYLSSTQRVFAVGWDGPRMPDLQQLLGAYYARYVESARASAKGHRPVLRQDTDLVIRTSGHPRAFKGMAYLPQQLPPGISTSELR